MSSKNALPDPADSIYANVRFEGYLTPELLEFIKKAEKNREFDESPGYRVQDAIESLQKGEPYVTPVSAEEILATGLVGLYGDEKRLRYAITKWPILGLPHMEGTTDSTDKFLYMHLRANDMFEEEIWNELRGDVKKRKQLAKELKEKYRNMDEEELRIMPLKLQIEKYKYNTFHNPDRLGSGVWLMPEEAGYEEILEKCYEMVKNGIIELEVLLRTYWGIVRERGVTALKIKEKSNYARWHSIVGSDGIPSLTSGWAHAVNKYIGLPVMVIGAAILDNVPQLRDASIELTKYLLNNPYPLPDWAPHVLPLSIAILAGAGAQMYIGQKALEMDYERREKREQDFETWCRENKDIVYRDIERVIELVRKYS
ncbi:hypothetical protein [Archaeoglobus veneficus]|uniref:Uncharacterized protein n=1 Tax=Archaeoglobus veneficus (strain DSM 11195 / SNP6) TaxID=693661 RepID=F2KRV3_ARCVS|nr:hypothetical protein [Archaeoglobus veneficus]AEA47967.1 hypothetical protein Arcve_1974 [Archaeoglobus veneficus SNP6]